MIKKPVSVNFRLSPAYIEMLDDLVKYYTENPAPAAGSRVTKTAVFESLLRETHKKLFS